jgi:uroporphyrinogen-III synthase
MSVENVIRSVIITRPLAQAVAFAGQVSAIGRTAVIFPLLEIQPLADDTSLHAALERLDQFALVAFVSPNAVDAVFARVESWPKGVPIAIMGQGSRAALAQHGLNEGNAVIVSPRNAERTDSETLLEELDLTALRGRKVLIVRGESGRELLAERLIAAGCQVEQVAAYRRAAPVLTPDKLQTLQSLLDGEHDWVITSSEGLRVLTSMVAQLPDANYVAKMQQQRIIAPHARIAETARFAGFINVDQTGSGDERLLAALQFTHERNTSNS